MGLFSRNEMGLFSDHEIIKNEPVNPFRLSRTDWMAEQERIAQSLPQPPPLDSQANEDTGHAGLEGAGLAGFGVSDTLSEIFQSNWVRFGVIALGLVALNHFFPDPLEGG